MNQKRLTLYEAFFNPAIRTVFLNGDTHQFYEIIRHYGLESQHSNLFRLFDYLLLDKISEVRTILLTRTELKQVEKILTHSKYQEYRCHLVYRYRDAFEDAYIIKKRK